MENYKFFYTIFGQGCNDTFGYFRTKRNLRSQHNKNKICHFTLYNLTEHSHRPNETVLKHSTIFSNSIPELEHSKTQNVPEQKTYQWSRTSWNFLEHYLESSASSRIFTNQLEDSLAFWNIFGHG